MKVLLACLFLLPLCYCTLQLTDNEHLQDVLSDHNVQLLYFYEKESLSTWDFLSDFESSAQHLNAYNITLIKVECLSATSKRCSKDLRNYIMYGFRGREEKIALHVDSIYDENAIVASALHLLMFDHVPLIQSVEDRLRLERICLRSQCHLVYAFITGLGTHEHRVFLEAAYKFQHAQRFALTTSTETVKGLRDWSGSSVSEDEPRLWLFQCNVAGESACLHTPLRTNFHSSYFDALFDMLETPTWVDVQTPEEDLASLIPNILNAVFMFYVPNTSSEDDVKSVASSLGTTFRATVKIFAVDVTRTTNKSLQGISVTHDVIRPPSIVFKAWKSERTSIINEYDDPFGFILEQIKNIKSWEEDDDYTVPPLDELTEDDQVLLWVKKRRKQEGRSPFSYHPDFPQLIRGVTEQDLENIGKNLPVTAIVFYFPWDGVSEMLLRGVSSAYYRLQANQSQWFNLVRMDCFDWPQECHRFGITEPPILTIFYRGNNVSYRGVYTEEALLTIFTLNLLPYSLKTVKEMEQFLSDDYLKNTGIESNSVIVLHPSHIDVHTLHTELQTIRGYIPYTTMQAAVLEKTYGKQSEYGLILLIQKLGELFTSHRYGPVPMEELSETITSLAKPLLPHLDESLFNEIVSSPVFGIFFFTTRNQILSTEAALASKNQNIRFAWMLRTESLATELLEAYNAPTSGLVFCLLHKEKVCCYPEDQFEVSKISEKINNTIKGNQCGPLKAAHWYPEKKCFNYLHLTDKDEWRQEQNPGSPEERKMKHTEL